MNQSSEKFNIISKVHGVLIDSKKRAEYDESGRVNLSENRPPSYIVSDDDLLQCYANYAGIFLLHLSSLYFCFNCIDFVSISI